MKMNFHLVVACLVLVSVVWVVSSQRPTNNNVMGQRNMRGSRPQNVNRGWRAWHARQPEQPSHASRRGGRNRARRMGVTLVGPHVCTEKGSKFCCPGWSLLPGGKMCLQAKCEEGSCGEGVCEHPNLCLCPDGRTMRSCPGANEAQVQKCNTRCENGGVCRGSQCHCTMGYTGPYCTQPICGPGCLNGGRCVTPGRCACVYGFTGMRCERDYRKGPCFMTRANSTCTNEVPNVMCTKLFCCATVGEGWGHPCEECPARVGNCTKGRLPPLCTDINECEMISGLCEGGKCVNTDGSFKCDCPKGYKYDTTVHKCVDVNECITSNVCTDGTCINTDGAYMCECPEDYKLSNDGTQCISNLPGRCYTAIESGMCASPLSNLVRRTVCCCVASGQETLGKCFAAVGQFPERCAAIGTPEYARACDGASAGTSLCGLLEAQACAHGRCVDQPEQNDYYCECDEGYQPSLDGKRCDDVDECNTGLGQSRSICGSHGTCLNTDGSYTCHCHHGYENEPGSMTTCVDIDECNLGREMCEDGDCINTGGSFVCNCNDGYRVSATQQSCADINECVEQAGLCENGRCLNTKGFYNCLCHPGFDLSADGTQCLDENECERTNMCANGRCVNMEGKYKCECFPGFRLTPNGKNCVDVDECVNNPCTDGVCENSHGSFVCNCHRFRVLDESGTRCVLDLTQGQCFRGVRNGQCRPHNALAITFHRADCCCAVPGATSAWGDSCEPCPEVGSADNAVLCAKAPSRNMCELMKNPCDNGDCINMGGSEYRCECNTGFLVSNNQRSCIDFDECTQNLCSNGQCRNTPGSYSCTCNTGFILSGDVCEDVDECLSNPCVNGRCVNEAGSYRCVCEDGAMLDVSGHKCYDVRVGRCWLKISNGQCQGSVGSQLMTAEECCNTIGKAWGSVTCRDCAEFEFPCERGYKFDVDKDKCVNIDECDDKFDYCGEDAVCDDTEGSFRCRCKDGFTLDADGITCIDLRVAPCFYDDNCQSPTAGAVMRKSACCCSVGQSWGEDQCESCPASGTSTYQKLCENPDNILVRNECIDFPDLCQNGVCTNTDGSFACECSRGFTLDQSKTNCTDIDECVISPGLCGNGVCKNVNGDFQCICDEGYEVSQSTKICQDINECAKPGYCTGGTCFNTEGSYQCTCPDGRSLNEDGSSCVDMDECALQPDLCEPNGRCENMLGYYMCLCDVGYQATANAESCIDVDECATNNGGCHMGCTNTIGSYECTCEDGFALSIDGHTCADRDECMEQMNRCDGGRCENTIGAFRCVCFDGFMSTNDLQFCEDIDECAQNSNVCMHGKCHNTRGSYTCQCDEGYCVPQGQMICVDEDECEMSKHNCHVNADCNNTEGGYECSCINGFNGDGFMCHDDDECVLGTHMCHEQATCRNKLGTYTCDCNEGYHGDGFSCSDDDDCLENENLCGPHGECLNVDGSFQCDCPMGFATTDDLKACKDIDECAFEQICVNGRCHNVPGDFRCVCLDGYEKDEQGANCTDVDECAEVANCINGNCVNTQGDYECQCPEGFQSNPTKIGCVDNRVGDCFWHREGDENAPICSGRVGVQVTKASCCCAHSSGWGNPCEVCPEVGSAEYEILCPGGFGFRPNPITVLLEDINECVLLPGLCQGGKCINVFGSFVCDCNVGFLLNETTRTCEDVNECSEENGNLCGAGECQNIVGGYNCVCPEGYKSVQGGRKCEDIREAACHRYYNATSNECSSQLTFETTKKICCCYANFGSGWNNPCEPCPSEGTDEFLSVCGNFNFSNPAGICDTPVCENGICVATDDTYRCECKKGYQNNTDQITCDDENECEDEGLCFADAECTNTPGSYVCSCKQGFTYNEETETCVDIDECSLPGTCANGACTNDRGSFSCDCNQGFKAINDDKACEDVNECERDPCGHGVCQNVFGSFTCTCDTGFRISDNGDCVDINECDEDDQCINGVCDNTPGAFACRCNDGYKVTPDGRVCIDANECLEQESVCGVGTCQNMDGSFKCFCPDGYSDQGGSACSDINECASNDSCKFGRCENTPGSYICHCPENHELSANRKVCIDTREEECFSNFSVGTCSNPGNYLTTLSSCCCRCLGGGWGSAGACQACPAQNTSQFNDICPMGCGYGAAGQVDIDECKHNPCQNGKCINQIGSFKCQCSNGYILDDTQRNCVDFNECQRGNYCGQGSCRNTEGGFECDCDDGYYNGPLKTCLDINECQLNLGLNQCGFRCENTNGSFHCACPSGYKLRADGKMCEDVNECESDATNDCAGKGMTCRNDIGFYECLCPSGFRRVGTSERCVDVDECDNARVCSNGLCINEEGTYRCECNEGYDFDVESKLCIDNRQGRCYTAVHQRHCEVSSTTGLPFTKAECCCSRGKGWGDDCEACPHHGTAAFLDLCPHGGGYQPNGEDIDECKVLPGLCLHGTCINTLGAFRCACSHGYEPAVSKQACIDLNECLSTPNPCSFDCRNTEGSYECVCPKGYQVDSDSRSCVDVDECSTKQHNCQYLCINTVGSFKCECPHGFVQEDAQCVDKNECIDMPGVCGPRGICRNEPGGYHCECPRGFRRGNTGPNCMDVDECSMGRGPCSGNCRNVPGSYQCLCGRGFASNLYGRGCQDVDECVHSPCGLGQSCRNTKGSFQCGCSSGLTKVRGGCSDVNECQVGGGSCSFGCRNTYGGFSCSCPNNFFRLGSGHCVNGRRGFQQQIPRYPMMPSYQPQVPMRGMPPPIPMNPFGQDTVCYRCMPGGDSRRRQRRSANPGRFIEKNDSHGRASVNTTYPIEIYFNASELTHRTPLLNLRPSMKQLRGHSRYQIVSGNEDRRFRIHMRGENSVLHFAKLPSDADHQVIIEGGVYTLRLRASTTLSKEEVKQRSLESDVIEKAIENEVQLDVKIFVENP